MDDAPVITSNGLVIGQGNTAEPALQVTDVDTAPTDLLITASRITAGHFANVSTGATITQFTVADVATHQVVFVQDGSALAPSYVLTASDGQVSSTGSAVQTSFSPAPITAAPPPSPTPVAAPTPTPPPPPTDASSSEQADEADTKTAVAASTAAPVKAPVAPRAFTFFLDVTNTATNNESAVITRPYSPYGVDLNNRPITASAVTPAGDEAFRYAWLKGLDTTLGDTANLRNSLDALREQLQNNGDERRQLVASSIALSTGLSVGYVIWLVRGGALIGSMLSAMPAWQMIDPLPVLARGRGPLQGDEGGDDDASVEHLFDDNDGTAPPPRPTPAPTPTPTTPSIIEEAAP